MSAVALMREAPVRPVTPPAATAYRPAQRVDGAIELLGISVHDVSARGVLDYMGAVIGSRERAVILHANAFAANLAARHEWLRQSFSNAQMVFCDGDGIRMACRWLGLAVPPKVTYARWLPLVAEWCEQNGHSIYFLGGRPGVADLAARRFQERHPRIRIAGTHHGYFQKSGPESEAVVAEINRVRPDVLLVCFGMPIQEQWVRAQASGLATHVVLTGGAALDYASGAAVTTPPWMVRLQLEWLFRLWMEPRRLFARYVFGNPEFILRILAERVKRAWGKGGGA